MRRLSEGSARSLLSWNCENIPYKRKHHQSLIQAPADVTVIHIKRFLCLEESTFNAQKMQASPKQ